MFALEARPKSLAKILCFRWLIDFPKLLANFRLNTVMFLGNKTVLTGSSSVTHTRDGGAGLINGIQAVAQQTEGALVACQGLHWNRRKSFTRTSGKCRGNCDSAGIKDTPKCLPSFKIFCRNIVFLVRYSINHILMWFAKLPVKQCFWCWNIWRLQLWVSQWDKHVKWGVLVIILPDLSIVWSFYISHLLKSKKLANLDYDGVFIKYKNIFLNSYYYNNNQV